MIEFAAGSAGQGRRVGVVVSRFNEVVTRELLNGARDCLLEHGVEDGDITVVWVPGAWEVPGAVARLGRGSDFHALIALGAVIRGDTPHFEYISSGVTHALARLATDLEIPLVFGILTTNDLEQALRRAGSGPENKGWEAAATALEMANLYDRIGP